MNKLISDNKNNLHPMALTSDLVIQELKDETLIYNLVSHKACCLNATASFVWRRCDGQTSVTEIARQLAKTKKQPVNYEIVWLALEQLKEQKLLKKDEKLISPLGAMSRREVIKKVGLATMMALPIVSTLTAPPAIAATSGSSVTCSDAGDSCRAVNACCTNVFCRVAGINVQAYACAGLTLDAGGLVVSAGICTRVAACVGLPLINV